MHAKSGGSSGEPPDFLFIPAACRSRKDLPRSAGGGDRARNAGNRPRDAEDGATGTGTGAGCGARETGARAQGAGPRVRNTEDAGVGRRTQNAEHVDADAGTGTGARGHGGTGARGAGRRTQDAGRRTQNAERRTQNTGYWPRAAEHGKWGHEVQKTEDAGTGCRTQNTGYWPRAAEHGKRGHGAQETGHRRRGTSPRAWTAARLHTPARPRNNPPGPSTAGRLPPRAAATCRAYESESRRCRRARRTCCCRAAPRPT